MKNSNKIVYKAPYFIFRTLPLLFAFIFLSQCKRTDNADRQTNQNLQQLDSLFIQSRYKDVIEYGQQIISSTSSPAEQYNIFLLVGSAGFFLGDYDCAISNYYKAIDIAKELNDESKILKIYTNLGMVCNEIGYLTKAEYYFKQVENKIKNTDSIKELIKNHVNYGNLFIKKKEYLKAAYQFESALKLANQSKSTVGIEVVNNNLGVVYQELNDLSKATEYYNKCLKNYDSIKDKNNIAIILTNLGSVETLKKDFITAEIYFQQATKIFESIGFSAYKIKTYLSRANNYIEMKAFEKADTTINQALDLAGKHNLVFELEELYSVRIRLDSVFSDPIKSAENRILYQQVLNQRIKSEAEDKVKMAEAINTIKEKERDNLFLQEKLKMTRIQTIVFILLFIFAVTISVLTYRVFNDKAKMKEIQVRHLTKEIELMKGQMLAKKAVSHPASDTPALTKQKVEEALNANINESDWKIIVALQENPLLNNTELAERVNLSVEGVRSCLKKLYRYANLENGKENKRLKLIHYILSRIS